jgi:hypothetical protein
MADDDLFQVYSLRLTCANPKLQLVVQSDKASFASVLEELRAARAPVKAFLVLDEDGGRTRIDSPASLQHLIARTLPRPAASPSLLV